MTPARRLARRWKFVVALTVAVVACGGADGRAPTEATVTPAEASPGTTLPDECGQGSDCPTTISWNGKIFLEYRHVDLEEVEDIKGKVLGQLGSGQTVFSIEDLNPALRVLVELDTGVWVDFRSSDAGANNN